jgi:hypothetical protein
MSESEFPIEESQAMETVPEDVDSLAEPPQEGINIHYVSMRAFDNF